MPIPEDPDANMIKVETGLASVVYCRGLSDGVRLLGIAEFPWR